MNLSSDLSDSKSSLKLVILEEAFRLWSLKSIEMASQSSDTNCSEAFVDAQAVKRLAESIRSGKTVLVIGVLEADQLGYVKLENF